MKKITILLITLLVLASLSLLGCDGMGLGGGTPTPPKDYNSDIEVILPENVEIEHFTPSEEDTYYTSKGLSLWASVNGEFLELKYFSLDGNKRVYDDIYFYKDDYFYMLTDDLTDLYASLGDESDYQYASEERELGEDIQINITKPGIYKVIFDTDTLKFDLEYKSEIETPRYYTIKNCSIYSVSTSWVEMSKNPKNEDEFYIEGFNVEEGKTISFFNNIHVSNYNVTLDQSTDGRYAGARKTSVTVYIGGAYNIYINSKTYEVRMELISPDTAKYSCIYYKDGDFISLTQDEREPYIFRMELVGEKYDTVPSVYTESYLEYKLTPKSTEFVSQTGSSLYLRKDGTYNITINLKTFEILVDLQLPE